MKYLVGFCVKRRTPIALPLEQCAFDLDLRGWHDYAKESMRNVGRRAQEAQQLLDPQQQVDIQAPPGVTLPDELVEHLRGMLKEQAKGVVEGQGEQMDYMSDLAHVRLIPLWDGERYFFQQYRIANTMEQALQWETEEQSV